MCKFTSRTQFIFHHGGPQSPLEVCGLNVLKIEPPDLFANLNSDSHPIATKSRRYNYVDREFIDTEVQRPLKEGNIEPSNSPWRAQVVVTRSENHERRHVIDYSHYKSFHYAGCLLSISH